ncbi:hypothetical protein ACJRO7_029150 [Eucalyptus globulus]|uniref:Uncharacterized protein n=1 Tax=Eucalyptus globulus TaxID=34317 RepID=A0ABD3K6U6_EUCGL
MRALTARLATYLCRRKPGHLQSRYSSSYSGKDELALEQEAEKKIGWLLKLFFAGTATYVGYQFFPYMGDNLIQQSISLLQVKDPLFKRMGASRLSRFAIDVEAAGVLHQAGLISVMRSIPGSFEDVEAEKYRSGLLKRFQDLRYDDSS